MNVEAVISITAPVNHNNIPTLNIGLVNEKDDRKGGRKTTKTKRKKKPKSTMPGFEYPCIGKPFVTSIYKYQTKRMDTILYDIFSISLVLFIDMPF